MSTKPSYVLNNIRAVEELRELLGHDTISTEDEDLQAPGYSEWSSTHIDVLPVAAAYPKNTEKVSQIAKTCTNYMMQMIPYSGGSSLEATFSAQFGTTAGYNLSGLFIGAEGTPRSFNEMCLKLTVIPQESKLAVVDFPTIRDPVSAAMQVIRSGVPVAAMEIMDEVQMNVIKSSRGVVEYASAAKREWSSLEHRRSGAHLKTADIINETKANLSSLALCASLLGDSWDTNFPTSIMSGNAAEKESVEQVVHKMVDTALEIEDTCMGEHSIDLGKKEAVHSELGSETIELMRTLKAALDPLHIMNPGRYLGTLWWELRVGLKQRPRRASKG